MQALGIDINDDRWQQAALPALASTAITATLTHLNLPPETCEISVLACDDTRIAALNADFRDKPQPTNVLSWPAEERSATRPGEVPQAVRPGPDGSIELGDIAISYDTCAAEAAAGGKPLSDHVIHLFVHATLHLLGYDHEREADGDLMETLEVEILGKLGLDDPYS
ncbi:MAG: rRNA maturation RNase YbeY [Pseudomonadota bacterium]